MPGSRALTGVEHPIVDPEVAVEPHRVVQTGGHHVRLVVGDAMGPKASSQQTEVGRIRQQAAVQRRVANYRAGGAKPDTLGRLHLDRMVAVDRVYRTYLDGQDGHRGLIGLRADQLRIQWVTLDHRGQRLGWWHIWHGGLVLESFFIRLKG